MKTYIPLSLQLGRVSQLICKVAPSCVQWCEDRFLRQAELWRREMHSAGKGILEEDYLRYNRGDALHLYMSTKHVHTSICTHTLFLYKSGQICILNSLCCSGTVSWCFFFFFWNLKSSLKRLKSSHVTDSFINFCRNLFQLNKTYFRAEGCSVSWFTIKMTGFILRFCMMKTVDHVYMQIRSIFCLIL